jgi:hypothetical protein
MELTWGALSAIGPVRSNNEDYLSFYQPSELEQRRSRGAVAIVADGVGGHGNGEVASRLAIETALQEFRELADGTPPTGPVCGFGPRGGLRPALPRVSPLIKRAGPSFPGAGGDFRRQAFAVAKDRHGGFLAGGVQRAGNPMPSLGLGLICHASRRHGAACDSSNSS